MDRSIGAYAMISSKEAREAFISPPNRCFKEK